MNDPLFLRKQIRVILSALPQGRKATEPFLKSMLDRETPEPVQVPELGEALEFNHSKGWIEYTHNTDTAHDEWFLTPRGRAKEGL